MINVVKYKSDRAYNNAVKAGNTSRSTILQTHEPFRIIVFNDTATVRRDPRTVSRITEIEDLTRIPTGNALLALNNFDENGILNPNRNAEVYKLLNRNKIKVIDELQFLAGISVEIPESMTFNKLSSVLNKTFDGTSVFSIIEEDVIIEAESCDYYAWPYSSQWHLDNIESQEAYELLDQGDYNTEEGTTYGEWYTRDVAIIDGHGFELTHPDLDNDEYPNNHPGRYMTRKNWNCVLNNDNPQAGGLNEKHGTVMAGIAASGWADRRFLRGVGLDHINAQCLKIGWNVLINGRFSTSTSAVIRALNKAALNENCAAIAMPFSISNYYSPFTNYYLNKVKTFGRTNRGMPIFAAAGNNGSSDFSNIYPASYDAVMAIGASTVNNIKASFSNWGPGLFATAPGVSIFAIDRCCGRGYNVNPDSTFGSVTYFNGTSASAVIAATIAGTMVVANPNITALEVKTILEITARRLGPYDYESESNEIGFDTSISPEMGNGILTQGTAIQTAIEYSEQSVDPGSINFELYDISVRWKHCLACPEQTTQPIPAGVYLEGNFGVRITNNTPNPLPINAGYGFPFTMSITLEEGGSPPIESTPMLPIAGGFLYGSDFVIPPGETVQKGGAWRTDPGGISCTLNGNYYLVGKVDPANYRSESSEEDNVLYEPVEFVFDNYYTNKYCSYIVAGASNNPFLQISSLNVVRTSVPNMYTENGFYWKIGALFTNYGTVPVIAFRVRYGWNPSIIGASFNSNQVLYSSAIPAIGTPSGDPDGINWMDVGIGSAGILPGQSAYHEVYLPYPPMFSPSILTGLIENINGFAQPIIQTHVAQSNVIYQ